MISANLFSVNEKIEKFKTYFPIDNFRCKSVALAPKFSTQKTVIVSVFLLK